MIPDEAMLAAQGGHEAAARALPSADVDPLARDALFGATPLGWAEHAGRHEVVALRRDVAAR